MTFKLKTMEKYKMIVYTEIIFSFLLQNMHVYSSILKAYSNLQCFMGIDWCEIVLLTDFAHCESLIGGAFFAVSWVM